MNISEIVDMMGQCFFCLMVLCVPFGVWKIVEIIIWLFHHVRIVG